MGRVSLAQEVQQVQEDEQREIRLDRAGFSMEHVPVTDQKGVPLCYAFAATQVIDAYRSRTAHKPLRATSAVAAAVETSWDTGLNYLETLNYGGFLCEAVQGLIRHGHCPQRKTAVIFRSILEHQKVFRSQEVEKKSRRAHAIVKNFLLAYRREKGSTNPNNLPSRSSLLSQLRSMGIKESYLPLLVKGVTVKKTIDPMPVLKAWVEQQCQGERQDLSYLNLKCIEQARRGSGDEFGQELITLLDQELNRGKKAMPLAAKYCANFLERGPGFKGVVEKADQKFFWREDCLIHYSLVIGRRWQRGQKQFLLRDSYGENCGGKSLHPYWTCDKGNIWVEEEVLLQNLLEIDVVSTS